ncbi:MAG: MBL fold metallo-hydrolase [Pseudomonadota bacterium]
MNKSLITLLTLLPLSVLAHDKAPAPEPMALDELAQAFGWDFDKTEIKIEKVSENLYVLFGTGGNIAVNLGTDGVFIVDDQFPQLMPKIRAAIKELGGDNVDFAVNTHWHFDHADGNLTLGPDGTVIVAHEASRQKMASDNLINLVGVSYMQEAYPDNALPDITYQRDMKFHYNDQEIELFHYGPAHTTGDTAVIFRGANAVHMGDVYNNSGYPFIDADNGGKLDGMIKFCQKILQQIDENTKVIPGHGPVADYQGLSDYIDMLTLVKQRLEKLIADGASLEEVFAAKPTAEFDEAMGNNILFINRAYHSLQHEHE